MTSSSFAVPYQLCMWLGCHAFRAVLSQHEPKRLSLLRRMLSCKIDTISNTLGPELLKRCFRATRQTDSTDIFTIIY